MIKSYMRLLKLSLFLGLFLPIVVCACSGSVRGIDPSSMDYVKIAISIALALGLYFGLHRLLRRRRDKIEQYSIDQSNYLDNTRQATLTSPFLDMRH